MSRLTASARSHPRLSIAAAMVVVAMILQIIGAQPAVSQTPVLTAYHVGDEIDLDPDVSVWRRAAKIEIPLTAQETDWPFGGGSVRMLEAQAVHTDVMLYIRMAWSDETLDTGITGVDEFVDAAAIEFPAGAESSVPALCMGQADRGVNIWHWQSGLGKDLPATIDDLGPNGYVDRYPSTDDLYFPAREAGNIVSRPRLIRDLSAVGFGTLAPASDQHVRGRSEWADGEWEAVFARELADDSFDQVHLSEGTTVDVAFAVWDGHAKERNGKKSVSQLIVLDISSRNPPNEGRELIPVMIGGALLLAALLAQQLAGPTRRDERPAAIDAPAEVGS